MRNFIVIFVMMIFAFTAKAQQVTDILFQYQGSWYYLEENVEFTPGSNGNIAFPFGVYVENTNASNLFVGDTVVMAMFLNDSLLDVLGFVFDKVWEVDSTTGFNLGTVTMPAKLLKVGKNELCVDIIFVTVNKVRESVMTEYCSDFKVKSTGIVETDNLKQVQVYPNPVNNSLKIENLDAATNINIYNVMGQVVRTIPSATGSIDVDMSDLSNGLYFIKMQNGKNVRTEKIQVVK